MAGRIDSLDSIPGLLKSLKIPALVSGKNKTESDYLLSKPVKR
jgi:hypothetical protein